MGWEQLVLAGVALVAASVAVTIGIYRRRNARAAATLRARMSMRLAEPKPEVAFIINPSKPETERAREFLDKACVQRGIEALWFETREDDPGKSQAKEAIEQGAKLVIAVGGDGTVRAVASSVAGTDVAMGIIPMGTGNLLARNLGIPLGNIDGALTLAIGGANRTIDVGWVTITEPRQTERHPFLVIAGMGFDAQMVADADDALKSRMGWLAYFFAGIRHMRGNLIRGHVQMDDTHYEVPRARSLMVANCGRLPAGINLAPNAEIDDGWLDFVAIDTKAGIVGWTQLFFKVVFQDLGIRDNVPVHIGRIDHGRGTKVTVTVDEPHRIQLDGDLLGEVTQAVFDVGAASLTIRTPTGDTS